MGYKIHRIKLTLLYTAATISFFMCLLAVVGVVPAIPWYASLACMRTNVGIYDAESKYTLDEDIRTCKILSVGLLVSSLCEGGKCTTKSNSKLEFGDMGDGYAAMFSTERNVTTSESIGSVSVNTDLANMSDVEKAGSVAFPFLLLGFIVVSLLGLLGFHHVVSETFYRKFTMGLFAAAFVLLLISWSTYIGIMDTSDVMDDFCDAKFQYTAQENQTLTCPIAVMENACDTSVPESEYTNCMDCSQEHESHCGPALGFFLCVLASLNMLLGGGLSFFTSLPDADEE